jgi:uncharacterized phage protein (TIGR02218 family)
LLNLPAAALLHLARESRHLTVCGVVYKRDGSTIRCTQFDDDIVIDSGDLEGFYATGVPITASDVKSSSDLSVDNLEISGTIDDSLNFGGFTVADIEAGLFNGAPFETFLCQWDDPNAWQKTIRRGYLGEINRTAEGQFTAEWRGLLQLLQQVIGRTFGELCDVNRFCDARCGIAEADVQQDTVLDTVTSRRRFSATVTGPRDTYFDLGEVRFQTGANAGYTRQIKRSAYGGPLGNFELWESMPFDLAPGDQVRLIPGCDRRFSTCQSWTHVGEHGNYQRFRGDGFWIPGIPKIQRAPG